MVWGAAGCRVLGAGCPLRLSTLLGMRLLLLPSHPKLNNFIGFTPNHHHRHHGEPPVIHQYIKK